MADPTVYELLRDQIEGGFERLERQNTDILAQQKLTNGRVSEHTTQIAVLTARQDGMGQRIETVSARSHETANKLQIFMAGGVGKTIARIIARDVGLVIATVTVVVAVLKFLRVIP